MSQDPRVYFAAERTFLAWVRSGIALMALGFVVSKFGLFLTLVSKAAPDAMAGVQLMNDITYSDIIGLVLVLIGVMMILGAQFNHQHYVKTLPPENVPTMPVRWLSGLLTYSVAFSGIFLAVYLIYL